MIMWLLPDTAVLITQAATSVYLGRKAKSNLYCKLPAGFKFLFPNIIDIATAAVRGATDFSFQFGFFKKSQVLTGLTAIISQYI